MESIISHLINGAIPVLLAIVSWASVEVTKLIRAKTRNTDISTVMAAIDDVVSTAVGEAQHTTVKDLKETGKFTADFGFDIKNRVVAKILYTLSPHIIALANKHITDLKTYVSSLVEVRIEDLKENAAYFKAKK